jgi:hypothetical protein
MKFMLLMISLLSLNAFAEDINFQCKFTEISYIQQFTLEGSVENIEGKFFNAAFDFSLRKTGRNAQVESFSVTRDGTVQIFEAGTFYPFKTMRLASVIKGAELEYINLLIDIPPLHSSQIRFLDGSTFFGSCKSVSKIVR